VFAMAYPIDTPFLSVKPILIDTEALSAPLFVTKTATAICSLALSVSINSICCMLAISIAIVPVSLLTVSPMFGGAPSGTRRHPKSTVPPQSSQNGTPVMVTLLLLLPFKLAAKCACAELASINVLTDPEVSSVSSALASFSKSAVEREKSIFCPNARMVTGSGMRIPLSGLLS